MNQVGKHEFGPSEIKGSYFDPEMARQRILRPNMIWEKSSVGNACPGRPNLECLLKQALKQDWWSLRV